MRVEQSISVSEGFELFADDARADAAHETTCHGILHVQADEEVDIVGVPGKKRVSRSAVGAGRSTTYLYIFFSF